MLAKREIAMGKKFTLVNCVEKIPHSPTKVSADVNSTPNDDCELTQKVFKQTPTHPLELWAQNSWHHKHKNLPRSLPKWIYLW